MTGARRRSPSLLPQTRALLARRGVRPNPARGQHFLVDPRIREAIATAAGIVPGRTVVEVGPGTGALTEGLLQRGAAVLAVELDRELASILMETLGANPDLTIRVGDALRFDFRAHFADHPERGRIRMVANIPYYITTPLILRLLRCREVFDALFLTIQREVADRITASPGCKAYGSLTLQ